MEGVLCDQISWETHSELCSMQYWCKVHHLIFREIPPISSHWSFCRIGSTYKDMKLSRSLCVQRPNINVTYAVMTSPFCSHQYLTKRSICCLFCKLVVSSKRTVKPVVSSKRTVKPLRHNFFRRTGPRSSEKQYDTSLQPKLKSLFFVTSQLNMMWNILVMLSHDLREYSA